MQASARVRTAFVAGVALLIGIGAWALLGGDDASRADGPNGASSVSSGGSGGGGSGGSGDSGDSAGSAGSGGADSSGTGDTEQGSSVGQGGSTSPDPAEGTEAEATGEIVPVEPVRTKAPVPIDAVGRFGTGLTVRLTEVSAVEVEAKAPGEIAGPGLRLTVEATNGARGALSLDHVVVSVSYGADRTPASQFGSSSEPMSGRLAPGRSRTGTYVYALPPDQRDDVRVEVSYTGSAPTLAFSGSIDD